jgi:hypothetical protein
VTLARVGRAADAAAAADELCRRCPASAELLLQAARGYALCAAGEADQRRKAELAGSAVAALRGVVAAGWKDRRLVEGDLELTPIRGEPGYLEVVAKLRAVSP